MGAKRMRTSRQQLIEEPATLADRTANGAGADAEPARKLALGEVKKSGATDVRGLIKTYANAAFEQQGKDIPKYIWHLHFEEFAAAIRSLGTSREQLNKAVSNVPDQQENEPGAHGERERALEEGDLNARLKAKGMYSIDEMMGNLPIDKWRVHSGMTDVTFFGEWLERKSREYLTMKAAYDVGDKDESDELYEWVLAHYGAFHDVLVNFRAALSSPDHADAGKVEGDGSAAARDVLAERRRQIEAEWWTPEHDNQFVDRELAKAAACYAIDNAAMWPWSMSWWKPSNSRRNLVKAGALILAEIERLDRLPSAPSQEVAGS